MDIDFGERPRASDGVHFANVGGMWQEIVHGFCGMVNALGADVLTLKPCMPKELKTISFQVIWKGQRAAITVTHDDITIKNMSGDKLHFVVNGNAKSVDGNATISVEY
jgi:trehalose/maltose hydrolase-like predicted phosphorylase